MDSKTTHEMLVEFHQTFVPAIRDGELRSKLSLEEAEEVREELQHSDDEPDLMAYIGMGIAQGMQKVLDDQQAERLYQGTHTTPWTVDREALAKELADVVYVAYGTALAYGIDLDIALREVHESNMTKLDDDGKAIVRDDGKILKGPNYRPPILAAALREE